MPRECSTPVTPNTHVVHGRHKLSGALWPKHVDRDVGVGVPLLTRRPDDAQQAGQAEQRVRGLAADDDAMHLFVWGVRSGGQV
jgi:hypothetical protein